MWDRLKINYSAHFYGKINIYLSPSATMWLIVFNCFWTTVGFFSIALATSGFGYTGNNTFGRVNSLLDLDFTWRLLTIRKI